MSQRGRGCLEIRPSDSAFYRTTTSEIGDTVVREREYDDVAEHEIAKEGTSSATQSFAFLYTRESDKIGSKVRMGGDTNQMSLTSKRGPGRNRFASTRDEIPEHGKPITVSPALILANYKQGTKIEDPRFTTTSNEYGKYLSLFSFILQIHLYEK